METIEALNDFKEQVEQSHRSQNNTIKLWGDAAIPALLAPKGRVLYQASSKKFVGEFRGRQCP